MSRVLEDGESRLRESGEILASNRLLARELRTVHQLLNSVRYGVVLIDNAGRVLLASRAAGAFLTESPEESRGKPARDCLKDAKVLELLAEPDGEALPHGVRTVELPPDPDSGRGCDQCFDSGLRGRVGIYELLVVDEGIRQTILANPSTDSLRAQALRSGMRTLKDEAFRLVEEKRTSLEEVMRVVFVEETLEEMPATLRK